MQVEQGNSRNDVLLMEESAKQEGCIPEFLNLLLEKEDLNCETRGPFEFLTNLRSRGMQHPVAKHPFFISMALGKFPNVPLSLLDFAIQKTRLCEHFHGSLDDNCGKTCHRSACSNTNTQDPLSVLVHLDQIKSAPVGVPHEALLRRFQEELARQIDPKLVDLLLSDKNRPKNLGRRLSEVCKNGNIPFAIGLLCCKVEPVIHEIYRLVIRAIERFTKLPPRAYFFFRFSIEGDSALLSMLELLANDFLVTPQARIDAAKGYWASLNIVYRYFMELYERSVRFPPAQSPSCSSQFLVTKTYVPHFQEVVYEEDEMNDDSDDEHESTLKGEDSKDGRPYCKRNMTKHSPQTLSSVPVIAWNERKDVDFGNGDMETQSSLASDSDFLVIPRQTVDTYDAYLKASSLMRSFCRDESPLEEDLWRLSIDTTD
eukprot:jgi/Galph1/3215/GphlegSOOS_G1860.1